MAIGGIAVEGRLALALLVAGIAANYTDYASASDDAAIDAKALYGSSNFHGTLSPKTGVHTDQFFREPSA